MPSNNVSNEHTIFLLKKLEQTFINKRSVQNKISLKFKH